MLSRMASAREPWNGARFDAMSQAGHYESWFVRANAPQGEGAFWIRYTIFSPRGRPQDAVGELWAIMFSAGQIVAVKEAQPIARCAFARDRLHAVVGEAALDGNSLRGQAGANAHTIKWDLSYDSDEAPIFLLPERMYGARFPRAKALVNRPLAVFNGSLHVDGVALGITDWVGSQNHNWGSRHTDRYAWGQVAGFDEEPHAFLECSTARLKLGPLWTPPLSMAVVRLRGETFAFNRLGRALRASGEYSPYSWHLATSDNRLNLGVDIDGSPEGFVALRYPNPPGGTKICLNSKVASCVLRLSGRDRPAIVLHSSRAAFEILDDQAPAGVTAAV